MHMPKFETLAGFSKRPRRTRRHAFTHAAGRSTGHALRSVVTVLALSGLWAALLTTSCGTYVRRFRQAELKIVGGRLERTPTGVDFNTLSASTSGSLITRVTATFGLDSNGPADGQLTSPADWIVVNFDLTATTDEMVIGAASLATDRVRDVIAHIEIYQVIWPLPMYSETWHSGDAPPFL